MNTNNRRPSRRRFVKVTLAGAVAVLTVGVSRSLAAADLPRLDEGDASAKALAYVHNASTVGSDLRADKSHLCGNCRFYTNADQAWGPCNLFPGKAVAAAGWCRGWVARA
ncbi:MAG: hypothetical protein ACI9DC_004379 [Gammaproteobacteria bacterium]|jgi:hypothetical protein